MNRLVPIAAAAVIGLGLAADGLLPPGSDGAGSAPARGDLTASALAAPDDPNVVDHAVSTFHAARGRGDVDTTASANVDCDGCSATATALHIAYLDRPTEATADNVTAAWSQCRNCSATAVSVQVVVLRSPQRVRVNNRSLAVNAACDGCRTAAAAYQLVVAGGPRVRLSAADVETLRRWILDRVAALEAVPPTGGSAAPAVSSGSPLDQLAVLVGRGLGGATVLQRDAEVRTAAEDTTPAPAPDGGPSDQPPTPPPTSPPSPPPTSPPSQSPAPTPSAADPGSTSAGPVAAA